VLPAAAVVWAAAPPVLEIPAAKGPLQIAPELVHEANLDRSPGWRLVEKGAQESAVPAAVVPGSGSDGTAGRPRLVANIPARSDAAPRRFELVPGDAAAGSSGGEFRFREVDDKSLALDDGDQPVLVYNHGVITNESIPKNDARRSRACFVHPIFGLRGETLTESFPKDHYHHHGLFWAWPHVRIEGREYDLWVYGNIQQRFVGWLARKATPVAAVLGVENGWFVGQRKVMIERVWLRVYEAADDARAIDVELCLVPVDKPVTLCGAEGKSYGGLNLRYAPRKEKETLITVPAGKTKEDLPDTPLAWADLTAKFGGSSEASGAAIFVDPSHPDFPPTWLTRHYGILCVGWPGVKPKTFAPGVPVRLNYRLWIHKDAASPERLQQAFDDYGAALKAAWK
jgi:hypothetical protein